MGGKEEGRDERGREEGERNFDKSLGVNWVFLYDGHESDLHLMP